MSLLPVVIFDDIEAWTVDRLDAALSARAEPYAADVLVATEVPTSRANRMVIVRRDGGGRLNAVLEAPRLGINIYAEDDVIASDLARLVAALLWAAPDGNPVAKVTVTGGPYRVTELSSQPRYYITAEVISKGRSE